jgi:hypothetical protein
MTVDGFRLIENPPPDDHKCPVPTKRSDGTASSVPIKDHNTPDGQLGDVWQCAKCMQPWLLINPHDEYAYGRDLIQWTKISQRHAHRLVRRAGRSNSSNTLIGIIFFLLSITAIAVIFYLMIAVVLS